MDDDDLGLPDDLVALRRIVEELGRWLDWSGPVLTTGRRVLQLADRTWLRPETVSPELVRVTMAAYRESVSRPPPLPTAIACTAALDTCTLDFGPLGQPASFDKLARQLAVLREFNDHVEPVYLEAMTRLTSHARSVGRREREEAEEVALADRLAGTGKRGLQGPANLVRFMVGRDRASFDDIKHHVQGDHTNRDGAIRNLTYRTNKAIRRLGSRLVYQVRGAYVEKRRSADQGPAGYR